MSLQENQEIVLLALQDDFKDFPGVHVYTAAGFRVAVTCTVRQRIVNVVNDITHSGSSYDVDGPSWANQYAASLGEVRTAVMSNVKAIIAFFDNLEMPGYHWNNWASMAELGVLEDHLLARGKDNRLLYEVANP